ncbi:MAG TPA: putative LPS assembly protein LptD, partial [Acidobacteriota bacterium]|nr:putative LPS assembly protein LptD [Acidobacteriota bacterium]
RFSLESERGRFDRKNDIAIADSVPVLHWDFHLDSAFQTIIWADTITYYRTERRGLGEGSVRVVKGDWIAYGGRGEVWPDSGLAVLTLNPRASGLGGEITGDTLELIFAGHGVERVVALGNAEGSYQDTASGGTGVSLLRGHRADFFLARDTLRAIRVIGQAYTDHVDADTNAGSNHASGDSLWLHFTAGRLTEMIVAGGAVGKYVSSADEGADTVDYKGALIRFTPDSNRIDLETDAQMRYGTIVLDAAHISYWTDVKSLLAHAADTSDSAGEIVGGPVLADGDQTVVGKYLTYNINTRRGRIRGSSTELEDGYYHGDDFRKYTDSIFFVTNGVYTTCDRPVPHFRFEGRDMVIIRGDKVIARPVVMRIGELPVAALPFYVFPIRKGRRSGFLPLRFGNFERGNRFISNVGYYWAASDYWDVEGAFDFNEATGIQLRSVFNYALRYHFSGQVSTSYARESTTSYYGQSKSTRWSLQATHQQTLAPTATLAGSATFLSDKSYYQDYSYDPTDRRNRSLRSQVNVSKRFGGASFSAALEATKNLDTDSRTLRLPQVSFSVFERRLLAPDSGADNRWYHNGYFAVSTNLNHYQTRNPTSGDTTGQFDEKRYLTVSHSGRLRFPQKLFTHITVSPNASFTETWYYIFDTRLARDAGVLIEEPARRASGSLGVSVNTNMYGFLNPRLFGLTAIRHTLTPRIGYSFTPAVTRHDELRGYTGAGSGGSTRSQVLTVSLSNTFDAKLHEGENEKKVSLLNLGFSTRYDFERDERRWGLLSGSARTNLANRVDISANATWDLYNAKTLDLQWTNPRLTNVGFSAAMSLRGDASALSSVTELGSGKSFEDTTDSEGGIPFNASLSYRYNETRDLDRITKRHWIAWRFDLQPSTNWSLQYQQTYDLESRQVTDQTFEIRRDLHCWQALFVWIPGGTRKGYYFRIGVKKIPDIKLERSESGLRTGFDF